ncbi:MAG: inositol monophosphatase family protein [Anaerolineales bacterium]|jgi:myo-inositol-1(or 4)-monophosphatase
MEQRLNFALDTARQAGEILRRGFGHVADIQLKGTVDLVTEHDLASEQFIRQAIESTYPDDAILAEEEGSLGEGEYRWLIDPLDGTTNFAHRMPIFSISIAYARGNQAILGVVYDPMRDELFHALQGQGAFLNGHPLAVSQTEQLINSLVVTGFPYDKHTNPDNNLNHFADLMMKTRGIRRLGSAALDLCYVAAGRFDAYWELRLWPWDWAAGILIAREAGGTVTNIHGGEAIFDERASLLATNGRLHQAMLDLLNAESSS